LVHAHYRGGDLRPAVDEQLDHVAPTQAMVPMPAESVLHG
jgi:hypothetical protein